MNNSYLIGLSQDLIPTPALVLDADIFESNMKKMMQYLLKQGVSLRPHTKTHKTPMIAHQQIKSGAIGLCCATISEAEVMVNSGLDNILIANEVKDEDKIRRLVSLARYANMMVAVDDTENLKKLSEASFEIGVDLGVIIEIDVGMGRCGARSTEAAVELAKLANSLKNINFLGIMGYEGHAVFIKDRHERQETGRKANKYLVDTAEAIRKAGVPVEIVSGAGSGTFDIAGEYPGITEIQAGSYIFMDLTYEKVGLPFEQSLTVLASVVSTPDDETVILNTGMKSISPEREVPKIKGVENVEVVKLAEEHAKCRALTPYIGLAVGDKVHLVPSHCCTTTNLYNQIYVVRKGKIEGIWEIAARGSY